MLSAAELTAMRSTQDEAMPDTGVIKRLAAAANSIGEVVETWAASGTADCRIAAPSAKDVQVLGAREQVQGISTWNITFSHGTDVRLGDQVTVDSNTYDVVHVGDKGNWYTAVRTLADLREAV